MKDYLPYAAGALAGLLVAFLISRLLMLSETPQLVLFALLPAVAGAVVERVCHRRPNNF
ncbi:hypothetical protein G9X68_14620 [Rhizobium sp. WYCCWR 11279]|uniref:hypothetical protein n=1 Tax=Rhizobium TaxID=379 RepID=UPI00149308D3|nr:MULTISPECIES: hypothetical protein [Rhizobium]MCV9942141.1 hypothetical protein [Rhizobium sp. BT-175]MCW0015897.1 hypothetical protein [Rhizobium sp. BT-226]NNU48340.1 hypothetical protein [Rhizobium changzhiense]